MFSVASTGGIAALGFLLAWSAASADVRAAPRSGTQSATSAMPALPGAQYSVSHSGEAAIAQHKACSRPPPPITRMRMPILFVFRLRLSSRSLCC